MMTWLLFVSTVDAPMRLATKRWRSGCTVRSALATMYQLGFDFQLLKHEPSALAGSSPAGIASVTSFRAQPRRSSQSDGLGGSIMSKTKRRTTAKANAKPRPIATSNPKLPIAGSWCT
jgi:hypothetical protein